MPIEENIIQGFQIGNSIYKYDYNALANIPKKMPEDESTNPILLMNKKGSTLNFNILNKPNVPNLGLYVLRAERQIARTQAASANSITKEIDTLKWVHPVNEQRYIDKIDDTLVLSNFDKKYKELWATSDVFPHRSMGYGSGQLYNSAGKLILDIPPILDDILVYDDTHTLSETFVQTEFSFNNNDSIDIQTNRWLFPAIRPNIFQLKLLAKVRRENRITYITLSLFSEEDATEFDYYLDNIRKTSGNSDSIFTNSNEGSLHKILIDVEWSTILTSVEDIIKNSILDAVNYKISSDAYNRMLHYIDIPSLIPSGSGGTETRLSRENFTKTSIITCTFIDWTNFKLIDQDIDSQSFKNLFFKFALVIEVTGNILAITPETVVVGIQFPKKINHTMQLTDVISSLENNFLPQGCLHVQIK